MFGEHRLKAIIVKNMVGLFAYGEDGDRVASEIYANDPKQIAATMREHREGLVSRHLTSLVESLTSKGYTVFSSTDQRLLEAVAERFHVAIELASEQPPRLEDVADLALEYGLIASGDEFGVFSHDVSTSLAHSDVHEALSSRESLLIPTVQLLGDMDTVINSLSGRMREWYGVHFPEMSAKVKEHTDYAKIILAFGDRGSITVKALQEMSLKKRDAERIVEAAQGSMGASFDDVDLEAVESYVRGVLDLYQERDKLSEYISMLAEEIAPNVARLAGPVLAAKLIDKAGGLKRMGMMPASTIQVLGAEKAMFRALKSNARPPKHGLLFQHPYVHGATRDKRGSRARALAAKLAIAARADVFSGEFIADDLLAQLRED
jgi:nucleolar protein 56